MRICAPLSFGADVVTVALIITEDYSTLRDGTKAGKGRSLRARASCGRGSRTPSSQAIKKLTAGVLDGAKAQTLLGVTGSGKTFTLANVIANVQKPTLVVSHNKTLAWQLYQEFKDFFPENEVHYFVSYYDYYQPEAYMPQTDTYIEKDAKINQEIDKLRHAATQAVLSRPDTIIVASVSCIYNIGDPNEYQNAAMFLKTGINISRKDFEESCSENWREHFI